MGAAGDYFPRVSQNAIALLEEFEGLAPGDKVELANAIFRRLPPVDSGPLDDELPAEGGDMMAEMLAKEENEAEAR
jgi:hypothetical protein